MRLHRLSSQLSPLALLFGLSLPLGPAFATETARVWQIDVSAEAEVDGRLVFRLTPDKAVPMQVEISIAEGRGENGAARDIRDQLQSSLGKQRFSFDIDGGETVEIESRDDQPPFALELIENTVTGLEIKLSPAPQD